MLKVFKFGGASVKDAAAVKNAAAIIKQFPKDNLLVVVSAMGKTTNSLECLVDAFFYKKDTLETIYDEIKKFHVDILSQMFSN